MKARSLMYHDVVPAGNWDQSGFPGSWSAHYKFSENEFAAHLDAIAAAWRGPAPAGFDAPAGMPLYLTFDDGGSGAVLASHMLEQRGWRGWFFITSGRIDTPGFVDTAALQKMDSAGHVIGSHSESHPTRMAALSPAALRDEWTRSVATLSRILNHSVLTASVPGGYYSTEVAKAAAASGIRWLFTSEPVEQVHEVDGCRILGRYAIHRGHTPTHAAALAAGNPWFCGRTRLWWDAKKLVKRAGPLYLALAGKLRR